MVPASFFDKTVGTCLVVAVYLFGFEQFSQALEYLLRRLVHLLSNLNQRHWFSSLLQYLNDLVFILAQLVTPLPIWFFKGIS